MDNMFNEAQETQHGPVELNIVSLKTCHYKM